MFRNKVTVLYCIFVLMLGCGCGSSTNATSFPPLSDLISESQPLTSLRMVALPGTDPTLLSPLNGVAILIPEATPDPSTQDILVVDAATVGVEEPTANSFLKAGKHVVFLNPSAEQKTTLKRQLGATTPENSSVLAVRLGSDAFGRPEVFLFDWPASAGPSANRLRARLAEHLQKESRPLDSSSDPPLGLLYVTYHFAYPNLGHIFTKINGNENLSPSQYTTLSSDVTVGLYLDNDNSQTGPRQIVTVLSDSSSSPTDPTEGTTDLPKFSLTPRRELGWLQILLKKTIAPVNPDTFLRVDDSPANANDQETVSTTIGVSLNVANPVEGGGGVSFSASTSRTRDVSAWSVENKSGGLEGSWSYYSDDPYRGNDLSLWRTFKTGGALKGGLRHLRQPSKLSLGELLATVGVVYVTSGLEDSTEEFLVTTQNSFGNIFKDGLGLSVESDGPAVRENRFQIDLSSVLPIAIQSIEFSENPTTPSASGSSVTGTVVLAEPAKFDGLIALSSDSNNAAVPPSVKIERGSTRANFEILTNRNNLTSTFVVNIRAGYGPSLKLTQLTLEP